MKLVKFGTFKAHLGFFDELGDTGEIGELGRGGVGRFGCFCFGALDWIGELAPGVSACPPRFGRTLWIGSVKFVFVAKSVY